MNPDPVQTFSKRKHIFRKKHLYKFTGEKEKADMGAKIREVSAMLFLLSLNTDVNVPTRTLGRVIRQKN